MMFIFSEDKTKKAEKNQFNNHSHFNKKNLKLNSSDVKMESETRLGN